MDIVVITGGSKGIGLEAVQRFLKNGCKVITCSRDKATWDACVKNDSQLSAVEYAQVDTSCDESVIGFFNGIKSDYGSISVAINNASPEIISEGPFKDVEVSKLRSTMESDLWSYSLCLKMELGLVKEGGAIVNVSSINGLNATPGAAMYSAAKHGIEGLTKSVALEAIQCGVRVNAVAPGLTWTPRWEARCEGNQPLKTELEGKVPSKRFASSSEIVDAIEWLSSPQSSYVVGQTIVVDGGLSLL